MAKSQRCRKKIRESGRRGQEGRAESGVPQADGAGRRDLGMSSGGGVEVGCWMLHTGLAWGAG